MNVAVGAKIICPDSVESPPWSAKFLVDPHATIGFADFPVAFATGEQGASPSRVAQLRRDFPLDANVRRATLYMTAREFEARINGQRVGDHLLAPGFTDDDTSLVGLSCRAARRGARAVVRYSPGVTA